MLWLRCIAEWIEHADPQSHTRIVGCTYGTYGQGHLSPVIGIAPATHHPGRRIRDAVSGTQFPGRGIRDASPRTPYEAATHVTRRPCFG
jgi:hypothetical protein